LKATDREESLGVVEGSFPAATAEGAGATPPRGARRRGGLRRVAALGRLVELVRPYRVRFAVATAALLASSGIVTTQDEAQGVEKVLGAAAMTYVAATVTAILQLLYFLYRSGLLGGSRN